MFESNTEKSKEKERLFMKMLVAKDRYSIAIMKAIGYTTPDIRMQFASCSVFVLLVGAFTGTLLANTLGSRATIF